MHQMKKNCSVSLGCLYASRRHGISMRGGISGDGEEMPLETILEGVRHQSNQASIHPHQPTDAVTNLGIMQKHYWQ